MPTRARRSFGTESRSTAAFAGLREELRLPSFPNRRQSERDIDPCPTDPSHPIAGDQVKEFPTSCC